MEDSPYFWPLVAVTVFVVILILLALIPPLFPHDEEEENDRVEKP
jgi:hypothetical protein